MNMNAPVPRHPVPDVIVFDASDMTPPVRPRNKISDSDRSAYEDELGFALRLLAWAMRNC